MESVKKENSEDFQSQIMPNGCPNCCCSRLRHSNGEPDSPWSFVVLCSGFICCCVANGCLYSFGVILPELMDYFGESRAKIAIVGSLGQGVGYLFSPLACYAFERFGYRNTVMFCAIMSVVGLSASAASPILPLLYLTYGCLNGIGLSFMHNAVIVVVMKHFVKWRSISSGVVQSAFSIGMLGVSQGTRKMIHAFGWRWALGGWAVLAFITFLFGIVLDGKQTENGQQTDNRTINQRAKLWGTLKNKLLILYSCSFALSYMAFYIPQIFLVKYSEERLSISRDKSTVLYMYFAVVSMVSRLMYCKIATYKLINKFILYQISMAFCGIAILLLKHCTKYVHLVLFMSSMGFLDGGFWGLTALIVTDCTGVENLNYGWGVFNCIISIGGISGAPLAGLIADASNSYIPAFNFSGATLLFASSLMFLRRFTEQQPQPSQRKQLHIHNKDELLVLTERETSV